MGSRAARDDGFRSRGRRDPGCDMAETAPRGDTRRPGTNFHAALRAGLLRFGCSAEAFPARDADRSGAPIGRALRRAPSPQGVGRGSPRVRARGRQVDRPRRIRLFRPCAPRGREPRRPSSSPLTASCSSRYLRTSSGAAPHPGDTKTLEVRLLSVEAAVNRVGR